MSKQQIVLGLIFASSAPALAQTVIVSPQRKVNPPGADWYECSVAVRIGQPSEVVVAAIHVPALADPEVGYGITLNGGTSFINGILALGVDPGVVADPATGRMWISALKNCGNSRIGVASKEPGGLVFGAPCCIYAGTGLFIDKPLMAISPDGSNHVMMYLMRKDTCESGPTCSHGVYATSTDDDAGCPWPTTARVQPPSSGNQGGCRWSGWGSTPVVLSTGRIVAVTHDHFEVNECQGLYNGGLPWVVFSDDGGLTWLPDSSEHLVRSPDAQLTGISPSQDADAPFWIDRNKCAPAIAVDRATDNVYVAFYARSSPSQSNTDIYISRSPNEGESFPPDTANLVQFTDFMLTGVPGDGIGPDQVMPSITIDDCGGVSLVFYDNRHDPDRGDQNPYYDVYFVRISNYGTGNQSIQQFRLTPQSFLPTQQGAFLGDYHHLASAPPTPTVPMVTLYPAYITPDGLNRSSYRHRIQVVCGGESLLALSDVDRDGVVQEKDVHAFEEAYQLGDCAADLDRDDEVSEFDAQIFTEVYSAAADGP